MDLQTVSELLRLHLPGLSAREHDIAVAYLSLNLMDLRDKTLTPDELLQVMHAIPLRATIPPGNQQLQLSGGGSQQQQQQQTILYRGGFEVVLTSAGRARTGAAAAYRELPPAQPSQLVMPLETLGMTPAPGTALYPPTASARLQQQQQPLSAAAISSLSQVAGSRILQSSIVDPLQRDSFLPAPQLPILMGQQMGGRDPNLPRLTPAQAVQSPWQPTDSSASPQVTLLGQQPTPLQQQQGLIAAAAAAAQAGALYIDRQLQLQQQQQQWMALNRGYVPPAGGYHQPLAPWVQGLPGQPGPSPLFPASSPAADLLPPSPPLLEPASVQHMSSQNLMMTVPGMPQQYGSPRQYSEQQYVQQAQPQQITAAQEYMLQVCAEGGMQAESCLLQSSACFCS